MQYTEVGLQKAAKFASNAKRISSRIHSTLFRRLRSFLDVFWASNRVYTNLYKRRPLSGRDHLIR